jgi:hypothetical protein
MGGVVHQDVQLAELGHRPFDGIDADVRIAQVALDDDAAPAFGFDSAARLA